MIRFDIQRNIWVLETVNNAYVIGVSESLGVNYIYFGRKLPYLSDYPEAKNEKDWSSFDTGEGRSREEYMPYQGIRYSEPCLKVMFKDGVRDVVLKYHSQYINGELLAITMVDEYYNLMVQLNYRIVEDCDLIVKWVKVTNNGAENIMLENVLSGTMFFPGEHEYRLTYLSGKWAGETQVKQVKVSEGKFVIESRRGTTSHHKNPFLMLDKNGEATEEFGKVYYGMLAFSGNWKMTIEKSSFNLVKVSAGINDFDFTWSLKPQETFEAPQFIIGCTDGGFGEASRRIHKFELNYIIPEENRNKIRRILYNSWEATYFDVNEENQIKLAERAASIGIELFVMDDGWFGNRNSDKSGLGDWYVNREKFPNGLTGLIKRVNELGMGFGLWLEPEMVNPDSNLYKEHPEWVYYFKTRKSTEARNQLILNLSRRDVREYIYNFIDDLLSKNNIEFIKWDMNRDFSEPGYPSQNIEEQREIWVRHVAGLYEIVGRLRIKHPNIIFQTCSGGGGRIDLGILQYFDQAWTSDNTDAFDRLRIQEGFSYAYSAKIMECWVTDETNWLTGRKLPLSYRFHSAMTGVLGIGADLTRWNEEEMKTARMFIKSYKEIRSIVQHGMLYRLSSFRNSNIYSIMYVDKVRENACVFVFSSLNSFGDEFPRIVLKGLEEEALYVVSSDIGCCDKVLSGAALMNMGIEVDINKDFESRLLRLAIVKLKNNAQESFMVQC